MSAGTRAVAMEPSVTGVETRAVPVRAAPAPSTRQAEVPVLARGPSEMSASVADVARALAGGELDRLVVIASGRDRVDRDPTVGLGRRLIANGLACVLVDLSGGSRIADQTGLAADAPGMRQFGEGEATLSEVIHRDRLTRLHVVPSRGYSLAATERAQADELGILMSAFSRSYDCALVVCESEAVSHLRPMLDRRTAVVTTTSEAGTNKPGAAAALSALGIDDVIVMRDAD